MRLSLRPCPSPSSTASCWCGGHRALENKHCVCHCSCTYCPVSKRAGHCAVERCDHCACLEPVEENMPLWRWLSQEAERGLKLQPEDKALMAVTLPLRVKSELFAEGCTENRKFNRRVKTRCEELFAAECRTLVCTLASSMSGTLPQQTHDVVLIDEAGQCTESDALQPISPTHQPTARWYRSETTSSCQQQCRASGTNRKA